MVLTTGEAGGREAAEVLLASEAWVAIFFHKLSFFLGVVLHVASVTVSRSSTYEVLRYRVAHCASSKLPPFFEG